MRADSIWVRVLVVLALGATGCASTHAGGGSNSPAGRLCRAALYGDLAQVMTLVEGDPGLVRAHTKEHHSITALHAAVSAEQPRIVEYLLDHGAEIDAVDHVGRSPLNYTALEIETTGALDRAQRLAIAKRLVERGATIDGGPSCFYPIQGFVQIADREAVEWFMLRGAKLLRKDCNDETPLHWLAKGTSVSQADVVMTHQSDPGAQLRSQSAAGTSEASYREMFQFLLDHGASIEDRNKLRESPLHTAAAAGNIAVARMLVAKGADVNPRDNFQETPLFHAARAGHAVIARLLASSGADVNARNEAGYTPLTVAARWTWPESLTVAVVDTLIAAGVDLDLQTPAAGRGPLGTSGSSALQMAAERGMGRVVESLVRGGASVDPECPDGRTALYWAAKEGHLEIVEFLVAHGANVNPGTKRTPLEAARGSRRTDVVEFLRNSGANR